VKLLGVVRGDSLIIALVSIVKAIGNRVVDGLSLPAEDLIRPGTPITGESSNGSALLVVSLAPSAGLDSQGLTVLPTSTSKPVFIQPQLNALKSLAVTSLKAILGDILVNLKLKRLRISPAQLNKGVQMTIFSSGSQMGQLDLYGVGFANLTLTGVKSMNVSRAIVAVVGSLCSPCGLGLEKRVPAERGKGSTFPGRSLCPSLGSLIAPLARLGLERIDEGTDVCAQVTANTSSGQAHYSPQPGVYLSQGQPSSQASTRAQSQP